MKIKVSFDDAINTAGNKGIDAAIVAAFGDVEYHKDGLIGMPFGTVELVETGKAYDWVMKKDHYVFMDAQ